MFEPEETRRGVDAPTPEERAELEATLDELPSSLRTRLDGGLDDDRLSLRCRAARGRWRGYERTCEAALRPYPFCSPLVHAVSTPSTYTCTCTSTS